MTAVRAHAFHGSQPTPTVPNTIKGIRAALPAKLRDMFFAELAEPLDQGDMRAVDEVKGKWWAQAVWNTDPGIREAFAAIDRGDFEVVPDPFAER